MPNFLRKINVNILSKNVLTYEVKIKLKIIISQIKIEITKKI